MHRGIISVTLSPSIDVTLWLDGLRTDEANRVLDETRGVGGKGINVSRVVQSFGLDNLCLAVAGRDNYSEFCHYLEEDGLRYELLQVDGVVRENLTLRFGEETLKVNRKGLSLSTMFIGALMALIQSRMHPGDIVVFGGSLPDSGGQKGRGARGGGHRPVFPGALPPHFSLADKAQYPRTAAYCSHAGRDSG